MYPMFGMPMMGMGLNPNMMQNNLNGMPMNNMFMNNLFGFPNNNMMNEPKK